MTGLTSSLVSTRSPIITSKPPVPFVIAIQPPNPNGVGVFTLAAESLKKRFMRVPLCVELSVPDARLLAQCRSRRLRQRSDRHSPPRPISRWPSRDLCRHGLETALHPIEKNDRSAPPAELTPEPELSGRTRVGGATHAPLKPASSRRGWWNIWPTPC